MSVDKTGKSLLTEIYLNKTKMIKQFLEILALLSTIFLCSCGSNIPTKDVIDKQYIVTSIESHDNTVLCTYNLETGVDYIQYQDNVSVVDSIGKFVIGERVYFSLNKLSNIDSKRVTDN